MSGIKFNSEEKCNIEIMKCMLKLLKPWCILITKPNKNSLFSTDELKNNIALVEKMIIRSHLDKIEINIIYDTLTDKKYNMDRTGRKYYYSDSGLRNKVNLILKKMIDNNF